VGGHFCGSIGDGTVPTDGRITGWPRLAWLTELERRAAMAPKHLLTDLTATEEDHLDVRRKPKCV